MSQPTNVSTLFSSTRETSAMGQGRLVGGKGLELPLRQRCSGIRWAGSIWVTETVTEPNLGPLAYAQ